MACNLSSNYKENMHIIFPIYKFEMSCIIILGFLVAFLLSCWIPRCRRVFWLVEKSNRRRCLFNISMSFGLFRLVCRFCWLFRSSIFRSVSSHFYRIFAFRGLLILVPGDQSNVIFPLVSITTSRIRRIRPISSIIRLQKCSLLSTK